jgi:hypothetical protein
MKQENQGTARRPDLALHRASVQENDGHETFRGLLADAGQRDLLALRHLLTCPLCHQLARVVLLEIPALELPGSDDHHLRWRQRRRHPSRQRS